MAEAKELFDNIRDAILKFDAGAAVESARAIVQAGADPVKAVDVMGVAMSELGVKFEAMECFLPEIIMASEALKEAMKVLQPAILAKVGPGAKQKPVVVIGTVKGDVHTVGKDMVATMLMTSGFDVTDLGPDVAPSTFLNQAVNLNATIIAASALMSTTLPVQKDLIDFLDAKGMRKKYMVIVGGGVATKEWSERIGADGYGQDAIEGVKVAKKLAGI
jgi:methylmalonyl-CoA mutase cobalamin-binding domain/chain